MLTYVTVPRTVEAVQVAEADFTGGTPNDNHMPGVHYDVGVMRAIVNTGYGQIAARAGDWIVRDITGMYVMTAGEFAKTYTLANTSVLDLAVAENARLNQLLTGLPNPIPATRWADDYINWYFNWKRDERARREAAAS